MILLSRWSRSKTMILSVWSTSPSTARQRPSTPHDPSRSSTRGLGTFLLDAAIERLLADTVSLDAWTREDEAANNWYRSRGFTEHSRYLHVYKGYDEPSARFTAPDGLSIPLQAFTQARIEDGAWIQAKSNSAPASAGSTSAGST